MNASQTKRFGRWIRGRAVGRGEAQSVAPRANGDSGPQRCPAADGQGQRTGSRITIEAVVAHDGSSEVLAGHLAVEIESLVEQWGCTLMDLSWDGTVVHEGDRLSPDLPVIRPA